MAKNRMMVAPTARPTGEAGVSRISNAAGRNSHSGLRRCGGAHSRDAGGAASFFASADFMEACLQPVQRRVAPGFVHELLVVAVFDDAAAFDGDDAIGVTNSRQPVGDDDDGPPFRDFLHVLVDDPLALVIERARRFVENQDAWVADQRARDGDALALASREGRATLADDGVVTERKLENEIVRASELRRGD